VAALCSLTVCGVATGQRLIVATTTMTAAREAAQVYLQSVDMEVGAPLPGPLALPGATLLGPLFLADYGTPPSLAVVSTGPSHGPGRGFVPAVAEAHISGFRTAPFARAGGFVFPEGWQGSAAYTEDTEDGRSILVAIGHRTDEDGRRQGCLAVYAAPEDPAAFFDPSPTRWVFPGTPVAAVAARDGGRAIVLCRGPHGQGCVVRAVDHVAESTRSDSGVLSGAVLSRGIADESAYSGTVPSGLALSGDGGHVFVLTSGHAGDTPSGEAVSWLHALGTDRLEEPHAALRLPGTADLAAAPLRPTAQTACWVATRRKGTEFAYATLVGVTPDGLVRDAHVPLTGVSGSFRVEPASDGAAAAVAMDEHLERWEEGRRTGLRVSYGGPIRAMRWTAGGLLVGEAGRIHKVHPETMRPVSTVQLDSGWVTDFVQVPYARLALPDLDADGLSLAQEDRLGTSPLEADSDGDGVPDGSHPEPLASSPRLCLPPVVAFRDTVTGQEMKALMIDSPCGNGYSWEVDFERPEMPWLLIHPVSGRVPGVVYLAVDPVRYAAAEPTAGTLNVRLFHPDTGLDAAGSPQRVTVRVAPEERAGLRLILWIRDEGSVGGPALAASFRSAGDPYAQAELGDLLAGPPHFFAHREAYGPLQEALDPYTIVLLGAAAASRGAVTRLAVLDYVAQGGALLLLGEFLEGKESPELTQWLSPLGIQMDTSVRMEGRFETKDRQGLCRHWGVQKISDGCALYVDDPAAITVSARDTDPHRAVFVARPYGRGRVAVLAAGTPLESDALQVPENRQWAADLFRWLAGANQYADAQDMDSDGLPDATEDRGPSEGAVEPGETNYLNPDTDGDGIPDGLEDANLNGRADEGETSALNPDSDGDGILDGADATPLPAVDAPQVVRVARPTEGPAEGGGVVQVAGRNFPPDAIVWFGDRLSPSVFIMNPTVLFAEVPPHGQPEGGAVAVRVVNPSSRAEGALPEAYRYAPRSTVRLTLQTLDLVRTQEDVYSGSVSIGLESPTGVLVDQVGLLLKAETTGTVVWGEFVAESEDQAARRRVVSRPLATGELLVVVMSGKRSGAISGALGEAPWEAALPSEEGAHLRFVVEKAWAAVRNGQFLDVPPPRPLAVRLRRARRAGGAAP